MALCKTGMAPLFVNSVVNENCSLIEPDVNKPGPRKRDSLLRHDHTYQAAHCALITAPPL